MTLREMAYAEMKKTENLILGFDWEDPVTYGLFLAQTHQMVSHSTRLVALAGGRVEIGNETLHGRFVDHSKEERGHQLVCISDLKEMGFKLEDFPALYQSKVMYQVQYYWIEHRCAASFFGYTLSLECLGEMFGPEVARRVVAAHGKKAAKFLMLHSEADKEHTEEAYKHLVNLSPAEEAAAKENLAISCDVYRSMLKEVPAIVKSLSHLRRTRKAG